MTENHEIIEPNFEGEEMRMPTETKVPILPAKASGGILNGLIITLLFIILVAILAGLYYWYTIVMSTEIIQPDNLVGQPTEQNEPESTTAEAQTQALNVVSTSDELTAIEADVSSTNMDNLDAELNAIDAELDAAIEAQ